MNKGQEYINKKTYSILKNNINKNNRDVVATIVFNELTDLLEYCNSSEDATARDKIMVDTLLHRVKSQLYSDIPMKLKPYCISNCNGYFRGLYDPYVLALLTEKADPWVWEDDGIVLLEILDNNKYITHDSSKN